MSNYEKRVEKLVYEMGFNKQEALMALQETGGDVNVAIERLMAGNYAPPPYQPLGAYAAPQQNSPVIERDRIDDPSKPTFSNLLADLRGKHDAPKVEDKPTAPSFFDLSSDLKKIDLPNNVKQMPPPYEVIDKSKKVKIWEQTSNVYYFDVQNAAVGAGSQQPNFRSGERCGVCFSVLENKEDVLSQDNKLYHGTCFRKKFGPKCSHCCFPLSMPDKDCELSGRYLVYKNKDYHVECYEQYAGPRCTYCFNVIIERPNGEFSGSWIVDGNHEYHTECYQKKLENLETALNT